MLVIRDFDFNKFIKKSYYCGYKNEIIMETILLFSFVGPEMIVVFFAILLLFGGKKIPELMRGIGKGIREFNTARASVERELKEGMHDEKKG